MVGLTSLPLIAANDPSRWIFRVRKASRWHCAWLHRATCSSKISAAARRRRWAWANRPFEGRASGHHLCVAFRVRPAWAGFREARVRRAGAGAHRNPERHGRAGNRGGARRRFDSRYGQRDVDGARRGRRALRSAAHRPRHARRRVSVSNRRHVDGIPLDRPADDRPRSAAARNAAQRFRSVWRFRDGRFADPDRHFE